MDSLTQALIIVGLFLLRLGVPVAITAAVAYLFQRMDARWQREAETLPAAAAARVADDAHTPCWAEKGCTERQRATCPACKFADVPCWLARLKVENQIPAPCHNCGRFAPAPVTI